MAAETLARGKTGGGSGGGAGSSFELDAARNAQSKSLNLFSLFCIFQAASCGGYDSLPNSIFCT